jgi:hypothetical protein
VGERQREWREERVLGLERQMGVLEGKGLSTLQLWSRFSSRTVSTIYHSVLGARRAEETAN